MIGEEPEACTGPYREWGGGGGGGGSFELLPFSLVIIIIHGVR